MNCLPTLVGQNKDYIVTIIINTRTKRQGHYEQLCETAGMLSEQEIETLSEYIKQL